MCKNYMCNCVYMSLLNFIRIFRGMLLNYGNLIIKSKNDKHYINHLKTTFIEYYTVMFSIYSVLKFRLNRSDSLGYIKHLSVFRIEKPGLSSKKSKYMYCFAVWKFTFNSIIFAPLALTPNRLIDKPYWFIKWFYI